MTCTVAVTNGIGTQTGKLFAFDAVSTITLTGLATAYNSVPCTGYITSQDGKTALAALATGTPAASALSLAFDFRTSPCRALFTAGNTSEQTVRLRVLVTATGQVVADALLAMVPGPEAGTTTTSTGSAAATLAQAQALVAAHAALATGVHGVGASTVASAADLALKLTIPTADGSALADANRFAVGQESGGVWTWCAKTGTQLKAWIKTYADTLYAAAVHTHAYLTQAAADLLYASLTHASRHAAAGADPVTPAAIGAYRYAASNAVGNVSGSITPNHTTSLTNTYTLTGNATAWNAPTGMNDGETAVDWVTLSGFTMPASPASGVYKGSWTVTGPLVRIITERIGTAYIMSADSPAVVT